VKYCSEQCRKEDATCHEDMALGHSVEICTFLRLCNEDEEAEEKATNEGRKRKKSKGGKAHCEEEDAETRIRSEYESYPATLANILMDGPCYKEKLKSRSCGKQSIKSKDIPSLSIHVIGASTEAELHGDDPHMVQDMYAEAFQALVTSKRIASIDLIFVGPECTNDFHETRSYNKDDNSTWCIHFQSYKSHYDKNLDKKVPPADIVVFFNPGFTCNDYKWTTVLDCMAPGTPFLVTTNSEMEGVLDCQFLFHRGYIPFLPKQVEDMIDAEKGGSGVLKDEEDSQGDMFFGDNPFAGSRIRQNGTMANDLFVKNHWMFGGCFGPPASPLKSKPECKGHKKKNFFI